MIDWYTIAKVHYNCAGHASAVIKMPNFSLELWGFIGRTAHYPQANWGVLKVFTDVEAKTAVFKGVKS
jgi:hypothetical protein